MLVKRNTTNFFIKTFHIDTLNTKDNSSSVRVRLVLGRAAVVYYVLVDLLNIKRQFLCTP